MCNNDNNNWEKYLKEKGLKEMLTKEKELVVLNKVAKKSEGKLSPIEEALEEFKNQNGYDFLEFLTNEKIQKKHHLKQHQIPSYDDDDFLKNFQDEQKIDNDD